MSKRLSEEQRRTCAGCVQYARKLANDDCAKRGRAGDYDDALSDAFLALVLAASTYDQRRGAFTTYAHAAVSNVLRRQGGRRAARRAAAAGLPENVEVHKAPRRGAAAADRLQTLLCVLHPLDAEALRRRAVLGQRWSEVASSMGCSRRRAQRRVRRALEQLRRLALEAKGGRP